MDDELRALIAKWRKYAEDLTDAASLNEQGGVLLTLVDEWHRGQAVMAEGCAKQLEQLLHARSTPARGHPIYHVRCSEPDCRRWMELTEYPPDPFYCPRCWQARGSKESER